MGVGFLGAIMVDQFRCLLMTRVATYPSVGGRRGTHKMRLPREENARSRHQHLFEENIGKTRTCGLRTLSVKGSRVVFKHGEGISTPRVRHMGRQPLIECARHDFKIMYFPHFLCCFESNVSSSFPKKKNT